MEGERARATAETDQLRGELETLKAHETTSIKRSRDEMLEHHGPLASRPAGHKRMRRAGVRNARSVSWPDCYNKDVTDNIYFFRVARPHRNSHQQVMHYSRKLCSSQLFT
jgi:hypothetical protein